MDEALSSSDSQRSLNRMAGDRYQLLSELGQGGMATVYKAQDHQLKRVVAIKILHHHLIRKREHYQRFQREAETIARLGHPGITEIFDFIEDPGEFLAIVMECVVGTSLDEFLDEQGPVSPEMAALLIIPIAEALGHAHQNGIIHRDLKPANILLDYRSGAPRLTDFGIAHITDEHTLTATGVVLGSPAFMAPQTVRSQPASESSDIYSLGAILYYMVTGRTPFDGNSAPELMRNIARGHVERADFRRETVGREFSDILQKLLDSETPHHPSTASELVAVLQKFIEPTLGEWRPDIKESLVDFESSRRQAENRVQTGLRKRAEEAIELKQRHEALRNLERLLALDPSDRETSKLLDQLHRSTARRRWFAASAVIIFILSVAALLSLQVFSAEEIHRDQGLLEDALVDGPQESGPPEIRHQEETAVQEARQLAEFTAAVAKSTSEREPLIYGAQPKVETNAETTPGIVAETSAETPATPDPSVLPPSSEEQASDVVEEAMTIRLRLIPAAATLFIDGEQYTAMEAARGVELSYGQYRIEARGSCCETHYQTLQVDEETDSSQSVVLNWKDGYIRLVTDRAALVWMDDDSSPSTVSEGEDTLLPVSFGGADTDPNEREISLRIADRQDLQRVRHRVVRVRPAQEVPVAVTLDEN